MVKRMKTWQMARRYLCIIISIAAAAAERSLLCTSFSCSSVDSLQPNCMGNTANGEATERRFVLHHHNYNGPQTPSSPPAGPTHLAAAQNESTCVKIWPVTIQPAHVVLPNRESLRNGMCSLTRLKMINQIKCDAWVSGEQQIDFKPVLNPSV